VYKEDWTQNCDSGRTSHSTHKYILYKIGQKNFKTLKNLQFGLLEIFRFF